MPSRYIIFRIIGGIQNLNYQGKQSRYKAYSWTRCLMCSLSLVMIVPFRDNFGGNTDTQICQSSIYWFFNLRGRNVDNVLQNEFFFLPIFLQTIGDLCFHCNLGRNQCLIKLYVSLITLSFSCFRITGFVRGTA